jgi:2-polyprenyl-3-methyl-5-hydroxy-6-metoxy-1,4-benzoquinol methylase
MSEDPTERQRREMAYHQAHFRQKHAARLAQPFSYDVLDNPQRNWWNAYWQMFSYLKTCELKGKTALVVGCGEGDDALRLARLGADVYAFDLSPEAIALARALAEREKLSVHFDRMPAERLNYTDSFFDLVLARDILHHVEIAPTVAELVRVSKPGALWVINEIYSHSVTDVVRRSRLVDGFLYPLLQKFIYGPGKPYITEDERKLSERDIAKITRAMPRREFTRHFNFLVTRVIPDRWPMVAQLDRLLLICLASLGQFLAGRILIVGRIAKRRL